MREAWKAAKDDRDALKALESEEVVGLKAEIVDLADEQLFLNSLVDALGEGSRELRVAAIEQNIAELEATMAMLKAVTWSVLVRNC